MLQTFTREVEQTLRLRFDNGAEVETTLGYPFYPENSLRFSCSKVREAHGNCVVEEKRAERDNAATGIGEPGSEQGRRESEGYGVRKSTVHASGM